VEAAGGTAHYHAVDLRDSAAVDAAIADVRQRHGRIDVLLHAAGLEISRNLPEKAPAEFDLVFGVKADGWFNLMRAARDLPIGATVCSRRWPAGSATRGRPTTPRRTTCCARSPASLRRSRPQTRAMALDWTAWGGIGMATRGLDPEDHGDGRRADAAARGRRGVDPPRAAVRRLPAARSSSRDALGLMAAELHADGGADLSAAVAAARPARCSAAPG
jgi:NAD(P)-dependent dehydrogenase (short-subunit alcohol dehydrogenase family)